MDTLDADVVAAARRLYDLGRDCEREARYLMDHYHAGYVSATVFDPVSNLSSAQLLADREAERMIRLGGDENDLDRADVISEEIERYLRTIRPYRHLVDSIHNVRRPTP
jgi:hypothetical protein